MASTRMRVSTSTQVYHRVAEVGDMPTSDIGTTDTAVQGLGGVGDFELESDETVAHVSASKAVTTAAAIGSSTAIADYIYIKHSGFTTSDKDVATASGVTLNVGLGGAHGATDVAGFKLEDGESITLHGLSDGCDNIAEIQLTSSSGSIYAEIVYL
jgi:hypothetical protein